MRAGPTVVTAQARRRWAAVLLAAALLAVLPAAVGAWPVHVPHLDVGELRHRIAASAGQPYQGYALSIGSLGLPRLANLGQVTDLLSGTTELRAWYAAADRWRVDTVGDGTEHDVYVTPDAEYRWDYGDNQLTTVVGRQPVRLPRAADLTPPELARRLVAVAAGDRLEPLPARRVAGIAAAGLRIVPGAAGTTVAAVDIWAEPGTGLPVQVEITERGADRPVFGTRFLEVQLTVPAATVLTPPPGGASADHPVTSTPDLISAINRRWSTPLPDVLAGRARGGALGGVSAVGRYGTGLAQLVVLGTPGRLGAEAFDNLSRVGQRVPVPDGEAVVVSTGLLTVLVVRAARTYLVAGLVQPAVMQQVATDLAGVPT